MEAPKLVVRAQVYLEQRGRVITDFAAPLGFGQDGRVWRTEQHSAIKIFENQAAYTRERDCYLRLTQHRVSEICGLSVPKLIEFDDELQVVEMGTVEPPFLLDFGKAYLDHEPEFPAETLAEWEEALDEMFGSHADTVRLVLWKLKQFGIYYRDAKPANIRFLG